MNKKCYIHIGMHKTGSTSIQVELQKNNITDSGFKYLSMDQPNHSIRIFALFHDRNVKFPWFEKNNWSEKQIESFNQKTKNMLINSINNLESNNMIISGEAISRCSKSALINLKLFLSQYFDDIYICAYVRPPNAFIASSFQQYLKDGAKFKSLEKSLDIAYPNYKELFQKFDQIFGINNVMLWEFNPKEFFNNNVVHDFYKRIGINTKYLNVESVNESLSREAVSLLYIYRRFGPGYGSGETVIAENQRMISRLSKIGNTKFKLAPSLIKPLLKKHSEDIKWIERRLKKPFNENIISSKDDISNVEDFYNLDDASIEMLCKLIAKKPNNVARIIDLLR